MIWCFHCNQDFGVDVGCSYFRADPKAECMLMYREIASFRRKFPRVDNEGITPNYIEKFLAVVANMFLAFHDG